MGTPLPAAAQLSGAVSLDSDFRFRGVKLVDSRPILIASLAYDHRSGAYAGVSAAGADVPRYGAEFLAKTAYAGYALRMDRGLDFDAGFATQTYYNFQSGVRTRVHYDDLYVGVANSNFDAHLRYSPRYVRRGLEVLYLDVNGSAEPLPNWRVFGHLGLSQLWGDALPPQVERRRWDARAGISRRLGPAEAHIAWTMRGPVGIPPDTDRNGLLVGASVTF